MNSIILKNYSDIFEELTANAAITPGMLVELMSTGKVRAHATAGGDALKMFAIEDALQGKGINDDYAAADKVRVWVAGSGDQVYALLADEQNVAIGDLLTSNGDGYLKKHTPEEASEGSAAAEITVNPLQIVGQVLEALDLSSLSAGDSSLTPSRQHVKIRIV